MSQNRVSSSRILAKECLVEALLQLIYEKSLSSINISELCQKAGVSRMTFYRNYNSIEDVFNRQLSDIFDIYRSDDMASFPTGIYCDLAHIMHYFDYIYEYRIFLDGLVQCGYDIIFLKMLTTYICTRWQKTADKYTLTAFAGSLYNMFRLWSDSHYTEDKSLLAQEIVSIFN